MADDKLTRNRKPRNDLTLEEVRAALNYDQDTGAFVWRVDRHPRGKAGKPAGHLSHEGYLTIGFHHKNFKSHILAWLLTYGEWPSAEIDHRNGVRHDNRRANLRLATDQQNAMNRGIRSDNTTGHTGVSFSKSKGKWVAYLCTGGKLIILGHVGSKEAAVQARRHAASIHFGEVARFS